jgi:hypothetical protein
MLYTPILLFSACAPVISPQIMGHVDRNLSYGFLASRPDEAMGKMDLLGETNVQTVPRSPNFLKFLVS